MPRVKPVFILSQPRSGSTLLQRLLGAHSQVATVSEPWFLLPLLYGLRRDGAYTEYGHRLAVQAAEDFHANLPGGRDDYLRELGQMAVRIYCKATPGDETVFLDKTPRYSLVADDLLDMFPDGRFIVLWRNPLPVVASCMKTFVGNQWMPSVFKVDLFHSLERLVEASARHQERIAFVRYEDLVTDTENQLRALVGYLGLAHEPDLVSRFTDVRLKGRVGDPTGVRKYNRVSTESAASWVSTMRSPVRIAWCRRYIRWIGTSRLAFMGYSADQLLQDLDAVDVDWSKAPRDVYTTLRGVVRDASEPMLFRDKLAALPAWRQIGVHT